MFSGARRFGHSGTKPFWHSTHNLCPRAEFACVTSSVAEFERPNIPAGRDLMAYSTWTKLVRDETLLLDDRCPAQQLCCQANCCTSPTSDIPDLVRSVVSSPSWDAGLPLQRERRSRRRRQVLGFLAAAAVVVVLVFEGLGGGHTQAFGEQLAHVDEVACLDAFDQLLRDRR